MTPVQTILQFIGTKELSPLADYIRKEILPLEEKMLGEAFDARQQWEYENMNNRKVVAPDKETYIESLSK